MLLHYYVLFINRICVIYTLISETLEMMFALSFRTVTSMENSCFLQIMFYINYRICGDEL